MRNLKLLFLGFNLTLLFFSCSYSEKKLGKTITFYESNEGICCFVLKNELHYIVYSRYYIKQCPENQIKDSLYIEAYDISFKKVNLISKLINFDTIYIANQESELHHGDGIVYNAKIFDSTWFVTVYYPYTKKGTYKFQITEEENNLFNSLLNNNLKTSNKIYPDKTTLDSLNIRERRLIIEFYLGINTNKNTKEWYSIFPFYPQSIARLDQLIKVLILKNLSKDKFINPQIKMLDIRDKFNIYAKTNRTQNFEIDIDSLDPNNTYHHEYY